MNAATYAGWSFMLVLGMAIGHLSPAPYPIIVATIVTLFSSILAIIGWDRNTHYIEAAMLHVVAFAGGLLSFGILSAYCLRVL